MIFNIFLASNANQAYAWLLVALFILLMELSTPGLFFFVAFAVGCIGGALAAYLGQPVIIQCLSSLGLMILSFWIIRRSLAARVKQEKDKETNISALEGCSAIIVEEIIPPHKGRVKIRGEAWPAKSDVGYKRGDVVQIVCVEGNSVIVKK